MQSSIRSLISAGHSSGTCIWRAQIVDEECLHLGCQCPYELPAKLKRSYSPLWSSAPSVTDQDSQQPDTRFAWNAGLPMQHSNVQGLMRVANACSPVGVGVGP